MGVAGVVRGAIAAALTALVAGLLVAVPVAPAAADDAYAYVYWQGNQNNTIIGTLRVSPSTWEAGDQVRLSLDYTLPNTEYHGCGALHPDVYHGGLLIRLGWSGGAVGSSTFSGAGPGTGTVEDQRQAAEPEQQAQAHPAEAGAGPSRAERALPRQRQGAAGVGPRRGEGEEVK